MHLFYTSKPCAGVVTNDNECKEKVLSIFNLELPAECFVTCPGNVTHDVSNGTLCLTLIPSRRVQERSAIRRKRGKWCSLGSCQTGKCVPIGGQFRCKVPRDRNPMSE
uniref:Evasin n=1 Tax=Amblyomma parvum TaxID=251391 RepID=A0A023FTN9_AMBPA